MNKFMCAGLVGWLGLSLSGGVALAGEPVKVLAGGPTSEKILADHKAELEAAMGTPLAVSVVSNASGLEPFVKGLVDGITLGTDLEHSLALAEKSGLPKQDAAAYEAVGMSRAVLRAGVHPENAVRALSREQLTGILSGKLTSWKPITGVDQPIKVILPKSYIFALKALSETYTHGQPIAGAEFVVDKEGALRGLKANPNAIVFMTVEAALPDLKPRYFATEAVNVVYLAIRKDARPEAHKLLEYFKAHPHTGS